MAIKRTLRRFVFSVPTPETEKMMVRTYIRATDGTEYPVDREIEVAKYTEKTVEYDYIPGQTTGHANGLPLLEEITEQFAKSDHELPPGTTVVSCEDIVTMLDDTGGEGT